jgi:uncharacterized protein DUF6600
MSQSRIVPLCVVLLASLAATQCEPLDESPPPATPQNSMSPAPTSNESSAPSPPTGDGDTAFASDEVAIGAQADGYEDDDPAALSDFHSTLDANGAWADDTTYGTIWVPSTSVVGADFQPYVTAGHWVYDDDWVWVSEYDWGWAPFHYGRWVWIEGRGWAWIPGRVYRGAWVTWGVDDGYTVVGWAPMSPTFVWFGGVAVGFPLYVGPRWVYCPRGDVFSPRVKARVVVGAAAGPIVGRVRPYVAAAPGVAQAGPPPQKLGFQTDQIPHASGATSVARAQEFARPPTAQALGAHAPTRISPPPIPVSSPAHVSPSMRVAPQTRTSPPLSPQVGQASGVVQAPRWVPHTMGTGPVTPASPAVPPPARVPAPVAIRPSPPTVRNAAPVAPAPAPRPVMRAPTFRVGGGGHHK